MLYAIANMLRWHRRKGKNNWVKCTNYNAKGDQ